MNIFTMPIGHLLNYLVFGTPPPDPYAIHELPPPPPPKWDPTGFHYHIPWRGKVYACYIYGRWKTGEWMAHVQGSWQPTLKVPSSVLRSLCPYDRPEVAPFLVRDEDRPHSMRHMTAQEYRRWQKSK